MSSVERYNHCFCGKKITNANKHPLYDFYTHQKCHDEYERRNKNDLCQFCGDPIGNGYVNYCGNCGGKEWKNFTSP